MNMTRQQQLKQLEDQALASSDPNELKVLQARTNILNKNSLTQSTLLKTKKANGQLVEIKDAQRLFIKFSTLLKNALARYTGDIATSCEGATAREISTIVEAKNDELLMSIHDSIDAWETEIEQATNDGKD